VRRYWIFDGQQRLLLFGGLDTLMRTELFAGLVPGVLGQSEDFLDSKQRDCASVLTAQSREAAVGVDARGALLILQLGVEGVNAARSACVGTLFPAERLALAGANEAYAAGSDVLVVKDGVLLFGDKPLVEAALAGAQPAPFPASLSLQGDEHVVFQLNVPEQGVSGRGALKVSSEAFRLALDLDLSDASMADAMEKGLQQGLGQAKQLEQAQPDLAKLIKALDVQRRGDHFTLVFELREPVIDQAHDVGVMTGLAFYGVRRYIQNAKSAEARANLAQIVRLYAVSLDTANAGKRPPPNKLVSLPPVPATVPRGAKYQSSAEDWKAWAPIHFNLTEPQYYQYQVVAAKDGKSAEILARGDLNGDGKASLFRVKIQLDPKTGDVSAVEHTEEAPLE